MLPQQFYDTLVSAKLQAVISEKLRAAEITASAPKTDKEGILLKKKHAVTIYDIASRTGVSGATVSKVLNGKGTVAEQTRERILNAAKGLGYSPNVAAKALRQSRSEQILLQIPEFSNLFYFDLVSSVHRVCAQAGYSVVLSIVQDKEPKDWKTFFQSKFNLVDAVIDIAFRFSPAHMEALEQFGKPAAISTVSRFRFPEKIPFDFVGTDTGEGTYSAASHLISLGHRKIGYIGLSTDIPAGGERLDGYLRALGENGIARDDGCIFTGGYTNRFGYECGMRIAAMVGSRPTAVCTANDMMAQGVYRAFSEQKIRIPEQIALVSMDNTDIADLLFPTLSSVAIQQSSIGGTAAQYVIDRLNGDKTAPHVTVFRPHLEVRNSSGAPLAPGK